MLGPRRPATAGSNRSSSQSRSQLLITAGSSRKSGTNNSRLVDRLRGRTATAGTHGHLGDGDPDVEEAMDRLLVVSLDELRNLYRSYFGHPTSLRSKETIARSIAVKALGETNISSSSAASGKGGPSQLIGGKKQASTSPMRSPRSTSTKPGAEPRYMQQAKPSGSLQLVKCLETMGIYKERPSELVEEREKAATAEGAVEWAEKLQRMSKLLLHRHKARLCRKLGSDSASSNRHHGGGDEGEGDGEGHHNRTVDEQRKIAMAAWKLERFLSQGAGYIFAVWPGIAKATLDVDYNGTYPILTPGMLQAILQERKLTSIKLQRIKSMCHEDQDAEHLGQKAVQLGIACDALREAGFADDDNGEDATPYATIAVDSNNLLQIRVYFSRKQVESILPDAAVSNYAFKVEAACFAPDRWIGVSGAWKDKILDFVRDPSPEEEPQAGTGGAVKRRGGVAQPVSAFFVDGLCFEKALSEKHCNMSDPFQCTVCQAVRGGNNYIYASSNDAELHRGMYLCAVCQKKTLHINLATTYRSIRPAWKPSIERPKLDYPTLSDPPRF